MVDAIEQLGPIDAANGEPEPTPELTREQVRSRRPREVRSRTINLARESKRERQLLQVLYPDTDHWRPQTRGDCVDGIRPCPYVGCKFNLYLDVTPETGVIKLNFPDLDPDELGESCALDVAEDGGRELLPIARALNVTRERVRQIEVRALAKGRNSGVDVSEWLDPDATPVRVVEELDQEDDDDDDE
jgi:hypothetical protein